MSVTAVPIQPLKKGSLTKYWAAIALVLAVGGGLAYWGTNDVRQEFGDVVTTASGLRYKIIEAGEGPNPTDNDVVLVSYKGMLKDGTVFDQNPQAVFPVTGIVPGFSEGLNLTREDILKNIVIPDRSEQTAIGNQRDGWIGAAVILKTAGKFRGDVRTIRRAPAIAAEEQFSTRLQARENQFGCFNDFGFERTKRIENHQGIAQGFGKRTHESGSESFGSKGRMSHQKTLEMRPRRIHTGEEMEINPDILGRVFGQDGLDSRRNLLCVWLGGQFVNQPFPVVLDRKSIQKITNQAFIFSKNPNLQSLESEIGVG